MGLPLLELKAADLSDKMMGEENRRFDALVEAMRLVAPAILFFDELEVFFPCRKLAAEMGNLAGGSVGARLPFLCGDVDPVPGLFICGAANYVDQVDAAVVSRMNANVIEVLAPTQSELTELYTTLLIKGNGKVRLRNVSRDCKLIQALLELPHPQNYRDVTARAEKLVSAVTGWVVERLQSEGEDGSQGASEPTQQPEVTAIERAIEAALDVNLENGPIWDALRGIQRKCRSKPPATPTTATAATHWQAAQTDAELTETAVMAGLPEPEEAAAAARQHEVSSAAVADPAPSAAAVELLLGASSQSYSALATSTAVSKPQVRVHPHRA